MEQEEPRTTWMAGSVSWGQLLIALAAVMGSVFMDRLTIDRRLTIVEERQQMVLRTIEGDQRELINVKNDIARKLDMIQSQLATINLELARVSRETQINGNGDWKLRAKP